VSLVAVLVVVVDDFGVGGDAVGDGVGVGFAVCPAALCGRANITAASAAQNITRDRSVRR